MNLTCKAYWIENEISNECDLAKSKEYGFIEHPDVVAAIPSSAIDTFCASAKHNSSPNTFSSDSAGLISDNGDCGLSAELTTQAEASRISANAPLIVSGEADEKSPPASGQTFATYKPSEEACSAKGMWIAVNPDGRYYESTWNGHTGPHGWVSCDCAGCGPGSGASDPGQGLVSLATDNGVEIGEHKFVFAQFLNEESQGPWGTGGGESWANNSSNIRKKMGCGDERNGRPSYWWSGEVNEDTSGGNCDVKYDFSTGIWTSEHGHKYKNGILVD
jgi:hypothetical protein